MKKHTLLFFSFFVSLLCFAQIPAGYYDNATGKTGDILRAALRDITTAGHVKLPYTGTSFDVWDGYAVTDVRPNPNNTIVWDMYSDIPNGTNYTFTIYTNQCGTASAEGGCYAREHSMPNSWWGGLDNAANPQYTDLHHLFPADQYVNNKKSAHPIGQVTAPIWTSTNGCKLGPCSWPGYTGTVFEPIDEYKGDFARAYFYLATRYMDHISTWVTTYSTTEAQYVINSSGNNFKQWYIDMLVTWSNNDPVSQKEINRNNAIYYNTPQHNRNPFIDHPEYICEIWTSTSCTSAPSITNILNTPVSPISTNTVAVTANVTDDVSVTSVTLQWCTDGTSFGNSIPMHVTTAPSYHTASSIPTEPSETTIYYRIVAVDNDNNSTTSPVHTYTVLKNQPTNHATTFSCGTTTSSTIPLTWTDATGAVIPDGYLIKMSNVSYAAISTPVDGVSEANSTFVHNIAPGVQTYTFTGLSQSTTYYFKIFPYTNSQSSINYKPSGTIPSTSCTTTAKVGCATDLLISEYMEGSSSNKYIEIYNNTGDSVNLSNYKLQLFVNGSLTPANNVTLSGILNNQTAIVYKNSSSTIYSGTATSNSAVNFNGDDAIALYKISDSSYVDIFGRIGEDPGTGWTSGTFNTVDHTLVRNALITSGITTNPTAGFPTLSTEWTQYPTDDVTHLGTHTMDCSICASPTLSSGNISFTSVTETSATIHWTNGNGNNRIVVVKEESPVSSTPVDRTTYTANPVFASGSTLGDGEYIVYNDSGSTVTVSNLAVGLTYYFTVFEYNCIPGSEIYLTPGTSDSQITYSLTTGATTDNSFCISPTTGLSTSVLIISTGSFSGNTYTAQLSDSIGSFANPINIGTTVSNSNNEAINCTIPPNTPTGAGYKIRVLSNFPSLTGTSSDPFQIILNTPPTGTASQIFCNTAKIADLTTTSGSDIQWYAAATGGVSLDTSVALTTATHYFATQTIGSCESPIRLDITATINAPAAPTGTASQAFCNSATVANLTATGTAIKWYAAASGGTALPTSTALVNTTHYFASQTISSCESATRLDITATINAPAAPTGTASQAFCNSATVANLTATGTAIKWYAAATGGSALATSTALVNNTHYFASQTISSCESATRLDVTATINAPAAPTGTVSQAFCNSATVADLAAAGTTIKWYAAASAGTALPTSTALVNTTHYFASQTISSCESATRLDVTASINATAAPTGTASQTFCNSATVADLATAGTTIKWYAAASGGTALPTSTALVNTTHYFASQTISSCESATRLDVTATINAPAAPTGTASQTFCNAATIADLTATGTAIKWYAAASGGTALATSIALVNNTHYFASQTISSCESATRLDVTASINATAAPTGTASQTFCNSATISDLTATGTVIKWYAAASGGTALATSIALVNNTHYFASQTISSCESATRLDVTASINATAAPTGTASQTFCNSATISDLTATGTAIKWYAAASGGTALPTSTALVNTTHYFASQTISSCESAARLDVTATINTPAPPTGTASQVFCNSATVGDLAAAGTTIKWYAAATGGTTLAASSALADNTHYFASQTISSCESATRLDVTTIFNTTATPTGTAAQTFCNSATIADLSATGTTIKWYAAASGGTALTTSTALANNTHYFASQTISSCESATRLDVTASVNATAAPTGTASQTFCNSATISDLTATGTAIKWYAAASGGTALPTSTALVNTTHYFASQTISSCESATRLDVTATINTPAPPPTGTASQTFCNSATVADLTATGTAIKWYAAATGGTTLAASTALADNTHYFASQTISSCESATRLDVTASINATAAPTATASQTFCNSATVADLAAAGTTIKWYAAASGGTALPTSTALVNTTHYFASQTISSCESATRLDVTATINAPAAPTGTASQTFCNAATIADLTATGTAIKWYAAATGGTALTTSTALANNTHYFASQTISSCESATRLDVTATINAPAAPTGTASQTFCNSATVADLAAAGTTIKWYAAASGGTALPISTALVNTTHYFASQTIISCESATRLDVTATINAPAAPTGTASQTFCNAATIADLTATGTAIKWYAAATGGTALTTSIALVNNTHYFASQTISSCESATRLDVTATINAPAAPTGTASQAFCNSATVADLAAAGTTIKWYAAASGGTALPTSTALVNTTHYFASQTISSCESATRLDVTATINAPAAPTGTASQTFCNAATIADLTATGTAIKWYAAATGGTALTTSTALANNTHYFASQTISSCESATRLDVTATINAPAAPTGTASQTFCNSATVADLAAAGTTIKWYAAASGGTALPISTALVNTTHYFASQTIISCESATRLDVTATINAPAAPTGTASQTFCNSATVADLTATGTAIKWYDAASGGIALPTSTALVNTTHYFASQTISSCESATRLDVTTSINVTATPTGTAAQTFCNFATIADLTATGTAIKWYDAATGGTALAAAAALADNTHYFASQTISSCESATRLDVTTTFNTTAAPTGTAAQTFCNSATIADLNATGTDIKWYAAATGGTALAASTALADNTHYFASQTIGSCESATRLDVTASINATAAPTGTASQAFCNSATIADLTATGTAIKWYAAATGGTALATSTALADNTHYFASQTISSCESAARLDITTTINAPAVPTGGASQAFCDSGTITDLAVIGTTIQWYDAPTGGTLLPTTTVLVNGTHYFASQTVSSCESLVRLDVTAVINETPYLTSSLTPPAICSNTLFNYTPTSSLTGTTLSWSRASITGISNTNAIGEGNPNETLIDTSASPVNVTYIFTLSANNCTNTTIYNVVVPVNPLPAVSLLPFAPVCSQAAPFILTGGSPSGGVYSGVDVNAGMFHPGNTDTVETITYTITNSNACSNEVSKNITVQVCTGIKENTYSETIIVYPNPSSGIINIAIKNVKSHTLSIRIFDVQGNDVFNTTDKNATNDYNKRINAGNWAKGIYFIKLSTDDGVQIQKLIIE